MISKERKAEIARRNGAKSKGPVTRRGKEKSSRNAIKHGLHATALQLFVPPHSAVLAIEDRQKFYRLMDAAIAQFKPEGDCELAVVRQIVEFQWKIDRNHMLESAMYHREFLRLSPSADAPVPGAVDVDLHLAIQDALAGHPTLIALRRDSAGLQSLIHLLQRRLQHLQKHWPENGPNGPGRIGPAGPAKATQLIEYPEDTGPSSGPVARNAVQIYQHIFGAGAPLQG